MAKPQLTLANYKPNPRARIGGNQRRPSYDPITLDQTFPGLRNPPGGAIIALADNALDITGPSRRLTAELADAEVKKLIAQIKQVDPDFAYQSLGPATTLEGQINEIRSLRMHRAAVRYNKRGDMGPLQVEVLRQMQTSADRAFDKDVRLYEAGKLKQSLSRNEAIGNFVDRAVRSDMKQLFRRYQIEHGLGKPVRVVGRGYITSETDRTYRIPDARVGRIAFDVTLERKLQSRPQIQGFFRSDFRPHSVLIVRPRQLGRGSTYAIKSRGHNMAKSRIDYDNIYIPEGIGDVIDKLGSMMLSAPEFESRLPWAFEEDIDTNFYQLNEGLKAVRQQIGDEAYARLVEMSDRMRVHFEADPEDKTEDGIKGRELIDEMTDILHASRRRKVPRSTG